MKRAIVAAALVCSALGSVAQANECYYYGDECYKSEEQLLQRLRGEIEPQTDIVGSIGDGIGTVFGAVFGVVETVAEVVVIGAGAYAEGAMQAEAEQQRYYNSPEYQREQQEQLSQDIHSLRNEINTLQMEMN